MAPPSELLCRWSNWATTGLRKISGNSKHSVVVCSDKRKPPCVLQTLCSQHVYSTGGFSCLQKRELSGLERFMKKLPSGGLTDPPCERMRMSPSLLCWRQDHVPTAIRSDMR